MRFCRVYSEHELGTSISFWFQLTQSAPYFENLGNSLCRTKNIEPQYRRLKYKFPSLFQALSQWGRSKKRVLDERDLVKKIGEGAETRGSPSRAFSNFFLPGQIPLVPRPLFRSSPLTESQAINFRNNVPKNNAKPHHCKPLRPPS